MITAAARKRFRYADDTAQKRDIGRFNCLDCSDDTLVGGECYMLRDEVLLSANPQRQGMLCIGCVEKRLGRRLTPEDFQGAPLDHHLINGPALSTRLMSRIGGPTNQLMRIHREYGLIYFDHKAPAVSAPSIFPAL
jgi:hypothetical protein